MAGNDVCSDIEYASVNGQVALGDLQKFDKKYPYPLVDVEAGKCYRFRYIMMASNAENYIVRLAGHNMTLIALDGVDVEPIQITTLNMHIGERADVVVCADQKPGYYPMEMTYDCRFSIPSLLPFRVLILLLRLIFHNNSATDACTLTPGHFIPPGFHAVSSCNFFSFLHYSGEREWPFYGAPTSPKGTGGGAHPAAVSGVGFDLTNAEDWKKTHPIEDSSEPDEPDARFVITLGLNGPTFSKPTDRPLTRKWRRVPEEINLIEKDCVTCELTAIHSHAAQVEGGTWILTVAASRGQSPQPRSFTQRADLVARPMYRS